MVDGAFVQGLSMPTKQRHEIAALSFHFFLRRFLCLFVCLFVLNRKCFNVKWPLCWCWRWAPQCGGCCEFSLHVCLVPPREAVAQLRVGDPQVAWFLHDRDAVSIGILPAAPAPC